MSPEPMQSVPASSGGPRIDWEGFYRSYRKPGYVPGYEIVNKLGGGMFGLVFKARKESIGKDYAIKFLKVDDEVVRDAVLRELDAVRFFAQVDHPNLVSIEDKGEIDGIPFIIMSYAGEETLKKRLETGRLGREDALRYFVQAARGVQALHERSLVHFDIKPANIFLKGEIARLGDYGLSKLVTESRNSLSFGRGTPYYMAPEMLQRRGDHLSDIYSLGILLFECLTGDVPFKGDSEWEVLKKHESQLPEFPAGFPGNDRTIVERCLAKRPEDRFQSVADLLRALAAPASLGDSITIQPATAGSRPAPSPNAPPPLTAVGPLPARPAQAGPTRGLIGGVVHVVFRALELAVFVVLAPIRGLAIVLGKAMVFLLRLPFQILGVGLRFAGYLVVALLMLLVLFTIFGGVAVAVPR